MTTRTEGNPKVLRKLIEDLSELVYETADFVLEEHLAITRVQSERLKSLAHILKELAEKCPPSP